MANFNKAFNFRGGFQVDEDVFIVRGQQVGIGTTIPSARLDVDGTIRAKSLSIANGDGVNLDAATVGILTAGVINSGIVSISNGIITSTDPVGLVTYYGDARFLKNLPTSQWVDIDVGLGYTSIYAAGNVGVDTVDPRYAFQVGGTPFGSVIGVGSSTGNQEGVAIYDGRIEASGLVTTRGDIFAGGEFVGVGSNITILNADNLGVGSIGSMRYGDLIVTKSVIADSFIGTASFANGLSDGIDIEVGGINVVGPATVGGALSVTGESYLGGQVYAGAGLSVTSDLSVGSGLTVTGDAYVSGSVESGDGFSTLNGIIQVGVNEVDPNSSDVEVLKVSGNSSIIAISENDTAQILVGKERIASTNIQYGGIRKGGSPFDPISNNEDLDIVNYDTGSLNFYLHSGNTGATSGQFQWIYGQNEAILASLTPSGVFNVPGNGVDPVTVTVGAGLTAEALFSKDISISNQASFAGDVTFNGAVTFSAGVSLQSLDVANIAAGIVTVGSNPATQVIIEESSITVSPSTVLTSNSVISANVNSTNGVINNLTSNSIASDDIRTTNGNFTADNAGNVGANDITANSISVDTATISSLNVTDSASLPGNVSLQSGSFDEINSNTGDIGTLSVTNDLNVGGAATVGGNLQAAQVNASDVNASIVNANSATFTSVTADSVETDTISSGITTITVENDIDMPQKQINATTINLQTISISANTIKLLDGGGTPYNLTIELDNEIPTAPTQLKFTVNSDGLGGTVYEGTVPLSPA